MFHMLLEEGSDSLRKDTARLYRAQFAFLRSRLEPMTVYEMIPTGYQSRFRRQVCRTRTL